MKKIFTIAAIVICALCTVSCKDKTQEYTEETDMSEMQHFSLAFESLPLYKCRRECVKVECIVRDIDEFKAHPDRFFDFLLSFSENGTKDVNLCVTNGKKDLMLSAKMNHHQHYHILLDETECVSNDDGSISYRGKVTLLAIKTYPHDNVKMVYVPQGVTNYYTL